MDHADLLEDIVAKTVGVPKIFWGIWHSNVSKGTIKPTTHAVIKSCSLLSYIIPTKIISCSKASVTSHISQGYDFDKFEVVQNGYDLTKFRFSPASVERIYFSS